MLNETFSVIFKHRGSLLKFFNISRLKAKTLMLNNIEQIVNSTNLEHLKDFKYNEIFERVMWIIVLLNIKEPRIYS